MCYTAFCIADGPEMSAAVVANLGRAGFTDAEIAITTPPSARMGGTHQAKQSLAPAEVFRHPLGGRSMVGATLGLIASFSAIAIPASGSDDGTGRQQTVLEGPASVDSRQAPGITAEAQEWVRAIAYHLCPGRSLIAVRTDNSYEVETILEIFRELGALHCAHIVEVGGPDGQVPLPLATTLVHDHTTILNDRVRESA
jgi:hypothetical protein